MAKRQVVPRVDPASAQPMMALVISPSSLPAIGLALAASLNAQSPLRLNPVLTLVPGAINGAAVEAEGRRLLIYGDPSGELSEIDQVLFTHGRRDVVWAADTALKRGARAIVPAGDRDAFTAGNAFWEKFREARYHDYAQQSTKLPLQSIQVDQTVRGGDRLYWRGFEFRVLDTPGYTRGAVSYSSELAGQRVCFVGDLIHGDGGFMDLYSLQDHIEEARIRGYHGYAGRMADVIGSLKTVLAEKPELLIPCRGPVIRQPAKAVNELIARLRAVYRNYLSINAGRWYFKESYDVLARRVLGEEAEVGWMPWAERIVDRPPDWIRPIQNSRLILSRDGHGFLVDCGSQAIVREMVELRDAGTLTTLDGVFITHYHDDHTDAIPALLEAFPCPVYACAPLTGILERPSAYRLPAMTAHPVRELTPMRDGAKLRWREFDLTFYDFPGQTIYHDALLVEPDEGDPIFFIGDSFSPSGIDDYCLLNRNLLHESTGYLYCLEFLNHIPRNALLINQHILRPFAFSKAQIASMVDTLDRRRELLSRLFPWDDPNYGIDERWVRFSPYAQRVRPGEPFEVSVKILNHSPVAHEFSVGVSSPSGLDLSSARKKITVPARTERVLNFQGRVSPDTTSGLRMVTADVAFGEWELRQWCEGMLEVGLARKAGP